MRKHSFTLLFISLLHISLNASASVPVNPHDPKADELLFPLRGTNKFLTLEQYMSLTPQDYRSITGQKMGFGQRVELGVSKHFIKTMIHKDGTVDMRKIKKRGFLGNWQWHWGGFALGLFLSFLGPIIALFFNDDYKWDRFWTAFHTALWVGLIAVIIAAALAGA
jgi:hypothetical protein